MNEYLKITSGEKIMFYPEFRISEMTVMPWYEDKVRIDIELATFDGLFDPEQKEKFESELEKTIENNFSNVCLRLECGQVQHKNLEQTKIEISDGSTEEKGGLVQLCVDWVVYLRNITIEFKKIENQLFTIWKAESEDIDNYSTPGLNTEYELIAKIRKVTELKDYQELLSHSKEIVKREVRYKEIISKMKGKQPEKVKLESIKPLEREFEYNDSISVGIK